MKEAEIDALAMPWVNARVANLLLVCRMMTMEVGDGIMEEPNPDGYDQVMFTQNMDTIEPFSSHMVLVKVGRAYTREHINIMVQALQTEDGSLPKVLTVQNTYTKLRQGSKKAVVVVRNNMAYSQTLWKKIPVARAVVVLPVTKPPEEVQLQEGVMSPRVPIPWDWLLGKDMVDYSMNWIWVGWTLGPLSWQMLPTGSWPNITMCSCWIWQSWAVPTPQNTW